MDGTNFWVKTADVGNVANGGQKISREASSARSAASYVLSTKCREERVSAPQMLDGLG